MKEEEIRPQNIFEEYLRLAAEDAMIYFGKSKRFSISCPACHSSGNKVFSKHGFQYEECPECQTLFVSPRPPIEDFFHYYQSSESAKYFATTFYKQTANARRLKLWRPKARLIHNILSKRGNDYYNVYDIGGGYGIFAEEYQKLTGSKVTIIEPGPDLAQICRQKGFPVIQSFLEGVRKDQIAVDPKVFVSFELFEHLHDSGVFLDHLFDLMQPGDLFIFTTLSSMGIDLQVLWDKSNSISLQHLNFFNPRSVQILLENKGFKVISVTTPGRLDMDILFKNREHISDRFWKNIITHSTSEERDKWQRFISSNGNSSHMFVVCERPAA